MSSGTLEHEYFETAIGPKNTGYYLEKFRKCAAGEYVSWNWPAFFVTSVWLLYRKMWLYATLYVLVLPLAIVLVVTGLLFTLTEFAATIASVAIEIGVFFVVVPMYANAFYYRAVKKRVAAAQARSGERAQQLRALARVGGTSNAMVILAVLTVPLAGIVAAIAIPAYRDFTIRAQVSEGLAAAAPVRAAVAASILRGEVPSNRVRTGLAADPQDTFGAHVESVEVSGGRIDITYGTGADAMLAGKVLSLTPYVVEPGLGESAIAWRCGAAPVPADAVDELGDYAPGTFGLELSRYLPSACRP